MAIRTTTQFKALYGTSGTLFPDNTTAEISEADVRAFGEDIADSFSNESDDAYTSPFPQVTASGTDTYAATTSPAITAYATGQKFQIKFTNASSGVSTLNLNALGAKKIFVNPTTQATTSHIVAGQISLLVYDAALDAASGGFLMIGAPTVSGGGTWGSITGTLSDQTDLQTAIDGKVGNGINDGVTTIAPSQDVVFDALALKADITYVDGIVVGLWDDRGTFDASVAAYPSSGGSGTAGAILKGDIWTISVAGTLPTGQVVEIGDTVRALIDTPGNTQGNWAILQNNIGFVPAPIASPAFTGNPTAPTPSAADNDTSIATTAFVQGELANYVNEEDFATLTFASPTVWACNSRQSPLAKLTATGDFTLDMTNVKSGSQGVLKITTSTASAYTITFDTSFTNNEMTSGAALLGYTFPADNGQVYFLYFVCDGTTLDWAIIDLVPDTLVPFAFIQRAAAQSINNNDVSVAVSFDTEIFDNSSIWALGTPNRLVIQGSGNKVALLSVRCQWAINSTSIRRIQINKNGSIFKNAQILSNATQATIQNASFQVPCVGGDYLEVIAYQLSGGALNLDACDVGITIHNA